ncbi:MAG: hypothetical protein D6734_01470 [Candidatus Schekmanbacteria bacterium]|nr:MAG: hypothetical protein D6734_01470 [Candidatus Schekmanbacteria bacterium]
MDNQENDSLADKLKKILKDAYSSRGRRISNRKRNILVAAGVHDPISASIASRIALKIYGNPIENPWAVQISGFGLAASRKMLPDTGEIGVEEIVNGSIEILNSVKNVSEDLFVMADIDHAYCAPDEEPTIVEQIIKAGICAFNIEDQQYVINPDSMRDIVEKLKKDYPSANLKYLKRSKPPIYFLKSCGHIGTEKIYIEGRIGGGKVILPKESMIKKIENAAAIRDKLKDDYGDVVINARTDIFGVYEYQSGQAAIDDALDRGNSYLEAGADMIFYEAVKPFEGYSQREVIEILTKETKGPVNFNALKGGKTKDPITIDEMDKLGVAAISLPINALEAQISALTETYISIFKGIEKDKPDAIDFKSTIDFLGWAEKFESMKNWPHETVKQGGAEKIDEFISSISGAYEKFVEREIEKITDQR